MTAKPSFKIKKKIISKFIELNSQGFAGISVLMKINGSLFKKQYVEFKTKQNEPSRISLVEEKPLQKVIFN